jgi:hypothetical protein
LAYGSSRHSEGQVGCLEWDWEEGGMPANILPLAYPKCKFEGKTWRLEDAILPEDDMTKS